ncbi:Enoyl-CoA hydratase/carnithine racemase [Salinisphaera sp. PC39]|uniref:crotonase/enoyl-CoA hydratase family protein n=1 Tax=Salinisphaera sp. PC39 TaxID=1304156 RepID=UPI003342A0BE
MTDRVITDIADGVAEVRLNRPDKHNALDQAMFDGIVEAGRALLDRGDVRAVVLHGDGPSFCSGLDYPSFMQSGQGLESAFQKLPDEPANAAQYTAMVWRRLPMPVIVAIHGAAFGGGLQLALGGDIRLAAPDARLSIMEVKWGLIPDMAATVTLKDVVGLDVAKELTFTGRVVDGATAADLRLVTRTEDDPLGAARALAAEIATKSPDSVRGAKRLFQTAWAIDEDAALAEEARMQQALIGSPNQMEAVQAALAKRPGNFRDPESGAG